MTLSRRHFVSLVGSAALVGAQPAFANAPAKSKPQAPTASYPDIIGEIRTVMTQRKDSLVDLARDNRLGYTEMIAANQGIDPWLPGEGVMIVMPEAHILPRAPRKGIVLNLADQRLYKFLDDGEVWTAPVGIGSDGWKTPTGSTRVTRKKANPTWYVPASIRKEDPTLPKIVPPGPQNPLGRHAVYLGWPAYLLHGTNRPLGVGRRVSHGCVRLYPEDIKSLYETVSVGADVTVVDQPVKFGWQNGMLFIEAHTSQAQADVLEATGAFPHEHPAELEFYAIDAAGDAADRLNWDAIRKAVAERSGLPTPILVEAVAPVSTPKQEAAATR